MNNNNQFKNDEKLQAEIEALKNDMSDILARLNRLSSHSREIIADQFSELIVKMQNIGEQSLDKGKDYYMHIEECVKKKPMPSVLYAFLAGALITTIIKR